MKAIAVIPARLNSTRLPRKVLADLDGHPLLWHVWKRTLAATRLDGVLVAVDCPEVLAHVQSWGGQAVLTSTACRCGTERIASILQRLEADLILNVQADEPLLEPAILDALVLAGADTGSDVATPVFRITSTAEAAQPSRREGRPAPRRAGTVLLATPDSLHPGCAAGAMA